MGDWIRRLRASERALKSAGRDGFAQARRRVAAMTAMTLAVAGLTACAATPTADPAPIAAPAPAYEFDPANPAFRREDVLGRTAAEIDALLGAPALVRTEGAGEFRRYDLALCGLVVLLAAEDGADRVAKELYASAPTSGDEGEAPTAARCLGVGPKRDAPTPGV